MSQFKQKIISVMTSAAAAYFGFEALEYLLSIYQIETYFQVSWYIFGFHVFWLTFIFDLHLKMSGHLAHARSQFSGLRAFWAAFSGRVKHFYHWAYVRRYLNHLILPGVIYWAVVVLMYLNPFREIFKGGLIIAATAALAVVYWYLHESFSRHMEFRETGLKFLSLAKLFAAYLAFAALMGGGWYFGLPAWLQFAAAVFVTFFLIYQALLQHRHLRLRLLPVVGLVAVAVGLLFLIVFETWSVNYFTGALLVTVFYNTCWGVMHRFLDRTLTAAVFWEYVLMLIVLASFILASHDFQSRVLY